LDFSQLDENLEQIRLPKLCCFRLQNKITLKSRPSVCYDLKSKSEAVTDTKSISEPEKVDRQFAD
jgi:hypothetical protein